MTNAENPVRCLTPESSPDWKAYALGELNVHDREAAETHAAKCGPCREELAMLRLTLDSLSTLPEIEIPRRIAFVSDPVFEKPAAATVSAPWWQMLLNPNFAAAAVVALAILAHGFLGGAAQSEALVEARVDAAVAQAVADVNAKQEVLANYLLELEEQNRQTYARNVGLLRQ